MWASAWVSLQWHKTAQAAEVAILTLPLRASSRCMRGGKDKTLGATLSRHATHKKMRLLSTSTSTPQRTAVVDKNVLPRRHVPTSTFCFVFKKDGPPLSLEQEDNLSVMGSLFSNAKAVSPGTAVHRDLTHEVWSCGHGVRPRCRGTWPSGVRLMFM